MIKVPQVDRGDTPFKVHLSVLVEGSVGVNLELPQLLSGHSSILQGGFVSVAPGGPSKRNFKLKFFFNKHIEEIVT